MKDLFGIDLETSLTCEESDETAVEASTVYTFKCNISQDVNHLHDGFKIGLCEDREKRSEKLSQIELDPRKGSFSRKVHLLRTHLFYLTQPHMVGTLYPVSF